VTGSADPAGQHGPRVLVTGASGSVGTALCAGLPAMGWTVRQLDQVPPLQPPPDGHEALLGDATDTGLLATALAGCVAVVHLAAIAGEASIEQIAQSHVVGTARVLEAARAAGVQRLVFASSNHAVGFTPRQPSVGTDTRPRPDTFYGVGKVAGEALCSLYSDRYGMRTAALRIGSFLPQPLTRRHLATWLSPGDLVRLVDACLRSADLTCSVVYGISANTRAWWDLEPGRALGYHPVDDAETYAAQILASTPAPSSDDPEVAYLGGSFARPPQAGGASAAPQGGAEVGGDLFARAGAWLAEDPDEDTRSELAALIVGDEVEELADRFDGHLEFGTAGLRGALGAGPNRMNRAVVIRAAAGLAAYLVEAGPGTVVIGYDARHKSDVFARDTAEVLAGAGLTAVVLPRALPTPVLAYAVRALGCVAGVMVTASHNPAQDNGYKVYLGSGSQLAPPVDVQISGLIERIGRLADVPRGDGWSVLGEDVVAGYVDRVAGLVDPTVHRDLRIVYTPMHGVGRDVLLAVFAAAGLPPLIVVPAQADPDPDFPTVAFPNPEEPGAMDLALAVARETTADLVLANDPDADRCAVGIGDGNGDYRMLNGDQVGSLLAVHLIRRGARGRLACSIVSSSLLGKIAAAAGLGFAETLTGFKWISQVPGLAYGYEEALGYCVDPDAVRDKDGISAALLVAELAAQLKADGRTVADELDDIARRYGVHQTAQVSVRVDDLAQIAQVMGRLRAEPPASLGGRGVESVDDLSAGSAELPPTDALRYRLEGDARVVVRPSGTEPKLKCYLEVVVPVVSSLATARELAAERMAALRADLVTATAVR
jgi:phosphomannomutase